VQWLVPLLSDPNFNNNRTLILLTFDENETYTAANRVYTLLLGNGLPANLVGQNDTTYYTRSSPAFPSRPSADWPASDFDLDYSALSTVEANWGLGSLGRGDTDKTSASSIQSAVIF
jgi:hypothetical protein